MTDLENSLVAELAKIREVVLNQFTPPHPFYEVWLAPTLADPFAVFPMITDFFRYFPAKPINDSFLREMIETIKQQMINRNVLPIQLEKQLQISVDPNKVAFNLVGSDTDIAWCEPVIDDDGTKKWRIVFLLGDKQKKIQAS